MLYYENYKTKVVYLACITGLLLSCDREEVKLGVLNDEKHHITVESNTSNDLIGGRLVFEDREDLKETLAQLKKNSSSLKQKMIRNYERGFVPLRAVKGYSNPKFERQYKYKNGRLRQLSYQERKLDHDVKTNNLLNDKNIRQVLNVKFLEWFILERFVHGYFSTIPTSSTTDFTFTQLIDIIKNSDE